MKPTIARNLLLGLMCREEKRRGGEERGKGGVRGKRGNFVKLKRCNLKLSSEESAPEAGLAKFTVIFNHHGRSSPARFCKIFCSRFFCSDFSAVGLFAFQLDSRTKVRPSSSWISGARHVWRWSKPSGSGFDGFRRRLNQSRLGSSSGIHSLIACQGGSMGSMV